MSADPQPAAGAASGSARADAQRESSAFQRAILECADYSIISTAPDGTIRTFNRAAERMLGYRADEVIGKVTPEIIHDYDEVVRRAAELTRELGRPVPAGFEAFVAKARLGLADEQEWTYIRKDGSRFPVQLTVTAMRDDAGEIIGFMGIAHDISRQRASQARVGQLAAQLDRRVRRRTEQVAAGEERFRLVVEASPSGLLMVDHSGRIVLINAQAERLFGYAREELLGQPVEVLLPERVRAAHEGHRAAFFSAPTERAMGAGRDLFARRKDGGEFPVEIGLSPMQTEDGPAVLATVVDIGARKEAEARLRASEERLKLAQHAARVGTFEWNVQTGVNTWSPELEALHGLPPGGFPGTQPAWERLVHPDDRARAKVQVQRAFDTNESVEGEWRVVWPDGSTHWLVGRFQMFRDAAGRPLRLTGVNLDITGRKRAEQVTATFAELGRALGAVDSWRGAAEAILAAVDRLFTFDALLMHIFSPDRRRVFRTLTVDTVDGRRVAQPPGETPLEPSAMFQRVATQGAQLVLREAARPLDLPLEPFGNTARLSASLMFVPVRAGGTVVGVLSVQSYQPRAYDAASLELLQSLADYAGTGLARVGAHAESDRLARLLAETQRVARLGCFEGNLLTGQDQWTDEAYRQMGYTPGEVTPNVPNFLARVHPDDRAAVLRGIEQIGRDGRPYGSEYRVLLPDGTMRHLHSAVAAEVDATGRVVRVYGAAQDVTRQKQIEAELRQSHSQLEQRVTERTAELARANVLLHTEVLERQAAEARAQAMFNALPDLIFRLRTDGVILDYKAEDQAALYVPPGQFLGRRMQDVLPPDVGRQFDEAIRTAAQQAARTELEYELPLADAPHTFEARLVPAGTDQLLLVVRDITERKTMEAELRVREEQLRDLFENATDLIQSVAPDGRLLFVNRAWLSTLGYRMSELAALTVFDIVHPDCLAEYRERFARKIRGEPLAGFETTFRAKDGRKVFVEGNASCRFERGRPVATRGIFRDVSKRKAVEAEREKLIAELQAALAEVKTLSGLLPVCGWCKKIRDDSGYWSSLESYLKKNAGVDTTHGICPECQAKMMAELDQLNPAPDAPPAS